MTQEDKELLLKDICARLPYGVKVWYKYYPTNNKEKIATSIRLADDKLALSNKLNDEGDWYPIEEAKEILMKPYLRPLSSMTEEEKEELKGICSIYIPTDSKNIGFEDYGILVFTHHLTDNSYSFKLNLNVIDWLNAHHFDYRNLIEKGLALKAPKDMYK